MKKTTSSIGRTRRSISGMYATLAPDTLIGFTIESNEKGNQLGKILPEQNNGFPTGRWMVGELKFSEDGKKSTIVGPTFNDLEKAIIYALFSETI